MFKTKYIKRLLKGLHGVYILEFKQKMHNYNKG